MDIYIVQLDSMYHLLHVLLPINNLQLEPVDIYIVQLVSILLDRLLQLRLLHVLLTSNHLQLEPVDIYIVQLGSILDRLLQLRLLHDLLLSISIQSKFLEYPEQLAGGQRIRSCFSSRFVEFHNHSFFSHVLTEHTGVLYDNFDLQSICDEIGLLDPCGK